MNNTETPTAPRNTEEQLVRFVKITRDGRFCIMPLEMAIEEARVHFTESEVGETFTWENVAMTQKEFDALPEFDGW